MKAIRHFLVMVFVAKTVCSIPQHYLSTKHDFILWPVSALSQQKTTNKWGKPAKIKCQYGAALLFNGVSDGLFSNHASLQVDSSFTIEAVFRPDEGGDFEQRFLHLGEINGSRIMLEIRSKKNMWYFDAFINANGVKKTLADSTLLHPNNSWYHVAFVSDKGMLKTYVNGKLEIQNSIHPSTFVASSLSIGVRQNRKFWFKGAIFCFAFTSAPLLPANFKLN